MKEAIGQVIGEKIVPLSLYASTVYGTASS